MLEGVKLTKEEAEGIGVLLGFVSGLIFLLGGTLGFIIGKLI